MVMSRVDWIVQLRKYFYELAKEKSEEHVVDLASLVAHLKDPQ